LICSNNYLGKHCTLTHLMLLNSSQYHPHPAISVHLSSCFHAPPKTQYIHSQSPYSHQPHRSIKIIWNAIRNVLCSRCPFSPSNASQLYKMSFSHPMICHSSLSLTPICYPSKIIQRSLHKLHLTNPSKLFYALCCVNDASLMSIRQQSASSIVHTFQNVPLTIHLQTKLLFTSSLG
jgi:hypothetical protein